MDDCDADRWNKDTNSYWDKAVYDSSNHGQMLMTESFFGTAFHSQDFEPYSLLCLSHYKSDNNNYLLTFNPKGYWSYGKRHQIH